MARRTASPTRRQCCRGCTASTTGCTTRVSPGSGVAWPGCTTAAPAAANSPACGFARPWSITSKPRPSARWATTRPSCAGTPAPACACATTWSRRRKSISTPRWEIIDDCEGPFRMNAAYLGLVLTFLAAGAEKPSVELLWPKGAPGAVGDEAADRPSLTVFLPQAEKANGAAVVVCPGGGYGVVVDTYEGKDPAEWLARRGVAAFVLRYRVAPRYRHPAPLQDVQRALRLVRARAREWHVDPHRVGVWGFSAGGHLASTAATHFDDGRPDADDPIDRAGCRPDFAILCYPVITLEPPYAHMGSRQNLLGKDPDAKLVESLCNE